MEKHREIQQNIPVVTFDKPQGQRTMEDFWRPVIRDDYFVVRPLAIEVNNFEPKLH